MRNIHSYYIVLNILCCTCVIHSQRIFVNTHHNNNQTLFFLYFSFCQRLLRDYKYICSSNIYRVMNFQIFLSEWPNCTREKRHAVAFNAFFGQQSLIFPYSSHCKLSADTSIVSIGQILWRTSFFHPLQKG